MAELKASVILDLVDRISRPVQRIERQFASLGRSRGLQQLRRSVANVGQQFGGVVSASGNLTRRLAVMGGTAAGAVWGFERLVGGVTDTADAAIKTADRLGVPKTPPAEAAPAETSTCIKPSLREARMAV